MLKIFIFSLLTNSMFFFLGKIYLKKIVNKFENIILNSIIGAILMSILALFTNFFFPLNKIINSILYLAIIISFMIFKKKLTKKEVLFLILSSFLTTILLAYDNVYRPDAGLYHLPYTGIINENKIIIGLSNIHFRFGHISIMQYLSGLNYNYLFNSYGILIPLAGISSFFILFFLNSVLKIFKKKEINLGNLFALYTIIYISYKINRYSGFGNDAVAHLCFFLIIYIFLNLKKNNLWLLSLLCVFAFTNKTTLALVLLLPVYLFFKNFSLKNLNIFLSLPFLFFVLWIIKNILVSGCVIYPQSIVCFETLSWADVNETYKEEVSAEAWTKGWPNRLDENISMSEFNKNFNWLQSWYSTHGKEIIYLLLPYLTITIFLAFYLIINKSKKIEYLKEEIFKNSFYFVYLISLLGSIIFFLKFPLFRYGYSYIITFIVLTVLFLSYKASSVKIIKLSKVFFTLCIITIVSKQFLRVIENYDSKDPWPSIYAESKNDIKKEIILNESLKINITNNLCMYTRELCTNYDLKKIKVKKNLGYKFFIFDE